MRRKVAGWLAVCLAAGLVFTACGQSSSSSGNNGNGSETTSSAKHIIVDNIAEEPPTLDPATMTDLTSSRS